ncbi:MAG: hypothetical protein ACRD32_09085 [Nitrososphaerales archaeon]
MQSLLTKKILFGLGITFVASILSCTSLRQPPNLVMDVLSVEGRTIAESVFRYQFERVRLKDLPQLYFISLGDSKDPTEDFSRKFEKHSDPVKKYSDSAYQNGIVTEKNTEQRGIRLEVKSIRMINSFEVEVEGSWFAGHENYQEQIFRVHKENGRWIVRNVKGILDP